ncbi:DUF4180 domain-containing protein [Aquabacter sp. CN5-332]|uniref:DUF4180 domain-containing protein n=1 Tax=Aquabacter sp. CN5-332 TaxID=3156608 RepID=UPI0032B3C3F6
MDTPRDIHGTRVLICGAEGPLLEGEGDIGTFLGAAWSEDAAMVAIPVSRLSPSFFQLSSRLAGEVAQKFVNYQIRLAVIGDISQWSEQSKALRDFVYESNRSKALWFVDDLDALERRLASA